MTRLSDEELNELARMIAEASAVKGKSCEEVEYEEWWRPMAELYAASRALAVAPRLLEEVRELRMTKCGHCVRTEDTCQERVEYFEKLWLEAGNERDALKTQLARVSTEAVAHRDRANRKAARAHKEILDRIKAQKERDALQARLEKVKKRVELCVKLYRNFNDDKLGNQLEVLEKLVKGVL